MVAGLLAGRFLLLLLQRLLLIRSSRQRLGIVLGRIRRLFDVLGFLLPTRDIAGLLDLRHFLLPRATISFPAPSAPSACRPVSAAPWAAPSIPWLPFCPRLPATGATRHLLAPPSR